MTTPTFFSFLEKHDYWKTVHISHTLFTKAYIITIASYIYKLQFYFEGNRIHPLPINAATNYQFTWRTIQMHTPNNWVFIAWAIKLITQIRSLPNISHHIWHKIKKSSVKKSNHFCSTHKPKRYIETWTCNTTWLVMQKHAKSYWCPWRLTC